MSEEHLINFEDSSVKEVPLTVEEIVELKETGRVRSVAADIKYLVANVIQSISVNDLLSAGIQLERIRNAADEIIEKS